MRQIPFVTLVALTFILVARPGWAQHSGSINGRITDPSGAVLAGVRITLDSEMLIARQVASTSESGAYRFTELPIGTYVLTLQRDSFQTVVREGVILTAGRTITVNIQMALSQVQQALTVTGRSPIVDVRQTDLAMGFGRDRLEGLPTARDPWVILEQAPGMIMDRQNVGGNESGEQSTFVNRGIDFGQNTWTYDGVNITDPAAAGAAPMHFDISGFDEITVTGGGADPNVPTTGVGVNFVTASGTNNFSGQGYFYGTHSAFQSTNVSAEQEEQGAGAGAPIKSIVDYGVSAAGPVVRDRAWFWAKYGVQDIHRGVVGFLQPGCTDPSDAECLHDDPTFLKSANAKVTWQVNGNNRFNFLWGFNDRNRATFGASDTRPVETTWKFGGPVHIYKIENTHVFNPQFLLTGRLAFVDGGFALDYQDPTLRDVQGNLELSTFAYSKSFLGYSTSRAQTIVNVDGNYFLPTAPGTDHEFKFGIQYKKTPIDEFTTYGGDGWAIFSDGEPSQAWLFRQSARLYEGTFAALHFQDVISVGAKATLKLGVRWDYQTGKNRPSTIPANRIVPSLLPSVDFAGTEPVNAWNNLSPRIGFTYGLNERGTSILRASYARYADAMLLYDVLSINNAANDSSIFMLWGDANGDRIIQQGEVNTPFFFSNYDPANPAAVTSPNRVDPNLTAPVTDEVIVGFEQEVMPEFAFSANFVWKRLGNLLQSDWFYVPPGITTNIQGNRMPFVGVPASAFVPVSDTFEGQTVTYYELAEGFEKGGDLLQNWEDYHSDFRGIELVGRKRLSDNWMMNVAFTFGTPREHYDGPEATYDPTNREIREEGQTFYQTPGAGRSGIFMNSRWTFKFDALYQFPRDWNVAAKFNGREGFVFPRTWDSPNRAGNLGPVSVVLDEVGTTRLDNLWVADLRVEKIFRFGTSSLSAVADVFNLFNANTVLGREKTQNISTANRIQDLLSPRIFRFGVRLNW